MGRERKRDEQESAVEQSRREQRISKATMWWDQ